jgi:hypothetical protein
MMEGMKPGDMIRVKGNLNDPDRPQTGVVVGSREEYAHVNIGNKKETLVKILWDTGQVGEYWASGLLHNHEVVE